MRTPSLRARARYAFDTLMDKGPLVHLGLLSAAFLLAIASAVALLHVTRVGPVAADGQVQNLDFWEDLWISMAHALDGGTMGGDPPGWPYRMVMFGITIFGLMTVSTLTAIVVTAVHEKLEELRRGRSQVVEEGHTLILGWTPAIFTIVRELSIANENQRRGRIVILAEHDKVAMENEIRSKVPDLRGTKIICRTGSAIDPDDIAIANPNDAKSIIVLGQDHDDADSQTIKTILAITRSPDRRHAPYHIVAVLRSPRNLAAARLIGGEEVELILASEVISRITVQTCIHAGLSAVYTELFDFDGDEIYMKEEPLLLGVTFGEALMRYETSCLIGLRFRDGRIVLNPPMDTVIGQGDQIFAISKDDDTVVLSIRSSAPIDEGRIRHGTPSPRTPKRTLLLGWNRLAPLVLQELDNYMAAGSEVLVAASVAEAAIEIERLKGCMARHSVSFLEGDTTDAGFLERIPLDQFDHVIVLGYSDTLPPQVADARTLITLAHLRAQIESLDHPVSIISEMLDLRNRDLASVMRIDDFIVSSNLISLMLAQISENKALNAVFSDLLDAEGMEIYLKPISDYVATNAPVSFYTLVAAARARQEVAIGYRVMAHASEPGRDFGVVVNPSKAEAVTFGPQDRLIVIAES